MKKKGLGRGLDALLGVQSRPADDAASARMIAVSELQAGRYQPRTRMDEGSLAELAESIRSQGVMQPLLVRSVGDHGFEIIAGERRFRAAQLAGLEHVPAIIRDVPDEAALVMALIENIQREDLSALEEAQGIRRLIDEFEMTHEQAAEALGKSRAAISNLLRLLNLTPAVQDLLMAGDLEMGHARALLTLGAAEQIMAAQEVVQKRLSVREAEKLAQLYADRNKATPELTRPGPKLDRDSLALQERLADRLAMVVALQPKGKRGGKLVIEYQTLDDLDRLVGLLAPESEA